MDNVFTKIDIEDFNYISDLTGIIQTIMHKAVVFTKSQKALVYLISKDEKNFDFLSIEVSKTSSWNKISIPLNFKEEDLVQFITDDPITSNISKAMIDQEDQTIGFVQLINKEKNQSFSQEDEEFVESIVSELVYSISNKKLAKELEHLLDSFIKTIATAIGEKSAHTGGHINRVTEITSLIAQEINHDEEKYKQKHFSQQELKQLMYASWLHDLGKITTPEYIIDKGTKLETIYDRIELIETRFEILKRDLKILYLDKLWQAQDLLQHNKIKTQLELQMQYIDEDYAFIHAVNFGLIPITQENIERINEIASQKVVINKKNVPLLSEDEVHNLCIKHGTLNDHEREIINQHVLITIKMLEKLPFPKHLKDVPRFAGEHHEKICGGGYPYNLQGDQICLESRIIAIADIFEAILSSDRPYKKAISLDKAMHLLYEKAKQNEIDRELVKFFVEKKIYLKYAKKFLQPEQINELTIDFSTL